MLQYNLGTGEYKNWIVSEVAFNPHALGKCEAIMALGNGYMGLRSATEESYVGQVRNLFVAGTFNQFDEYEVTELPNAPDVVELDIWLNGEKFSLEKGKIIHYRRDLNVKDAELVRHIIWENTRGEQFEFTFRRFVSLKNLHLIGMKMEIKPLNCDADVHITSGINGQMTNSGAQHFHEGEKRIFDKKYLQLIQTTTESKIDFVVNAVHRYMIDGKEVETEPRMAIDRRKVFIQVSFHVKKGETFTFEKLANVYTSRDKAYDHDAYSLDVMRQEALNDLKRRSEKRVRCALFRKRFGMEKTLGANEHYDRKRKRI
ncbi:Alpha,alpha-trehalose phosphorylase [Anoxybacillus sp. BCO1]|nr:Alpha,alpha-trehalose phosphorylase [Anoxybacillus sp. BCO1]